MYTTLPVTGLGRFPVEDVHDLRLLRGSGYLHAGLGDRPLEPPGRATDHTNRVAHHVGTWSTQVGIPISPSSMILSAAVY